MSADIEKRFAMLEQSEQEMKHLKEMLLDSLNNDGELQNLEDKLKDAKHRFAAQREAILNEPENRKVLEKIKDVAEEIKDTKKLLGDELVAYFMKNNTLEFTTSDGMKRRFTVSAKLLKGKE